MNIHFSTLTLNCRLSKEIINFSTQISFFHGKISAGKSSIARLIDYCLGGDLEKTTAITKELVSVELVAHIGEYEVLFEREARGSNQVQVTWRTSKGETGSVLAPLQAKQSSGPIWEDNVYNLSDLIFYLLGINPIKVRRSKRDPDTPLVRLSFRDIMWYCYLEQDHLDSSFFRLDETFVQQKSRDVMRFTVGYYTQRLNDLEIELEDIRDQHYGKIEAAKQLRSFLDQYGYSSEEEVKNMEEDINKNLQNVHNEQQELRKGYTPKIHLTDDLRNHLRIISENLAKEQQILIDLHDKVDELKSLKAELTSAKFKLARSESASNILSGVIFECCPSCGVKIESKRSEKDAKCYLCGNIKEININEFSDNAEMTRRDLTSRIEEIDESLKRQEKAICIQQRNITDLEETKIVLDNRLKEELKNYDSNFLARTRDIDIKIATLEERLRGLNRTKEMFKSVIKLEFEADQLKSNEEKLKRELSNENTKLKNADKIIKEIEETFLDSLLRVKVPGVGVEDKVEINRKTWMPSISPNGDKTFKYDFYNAGSGGKKTLLKVCYTLAVHKVAAENDLPLPTFLIIDTPMKNIGEDVNKDIFINFYQYLYELAEKSLNNVQFIIIDKECIKPVSNQIAFKERYMTPDEDDNPPLITYYRGP
jgi:hypothetical protein